MLSMQADDVVCPVSLDRLGKLYRTDPGSAACTLEDLSERQRMELAFFCYGRAHLRSLGMAIAATCDAVRLTRRAGMVGEVLAAQCREVERPRPKISLGGTRH